MRKLKLKEPRFMRTAIALLMMMLTMATTAWAETVTGFTDNGDNTYTIYNADGWGLFCDALDGGTSFSGKTVYLDGSISVSRMAGSSSHKFTGTFDGNKNTLTVSYGTEESPINEQYAAPFRYVDGATIQNLHVSGTIISNTTRAAGVIGDTGSPGENGTTTSHIINCVSSSTIRGGNYTGGFSIGGNVEIEGCVFDGTINSDGNSGGFVGYSQSTLKIKDCLFAPQSGSKAKGTFYYNGTAGTLTNCYYTEALGTEQGTKAIAVNKGYSEQVTPDYTTSGIKVRDGYMECDGVLYALAGASVTVGYVDETGTTTTHSATVLGGGSGDTTLPGGWYVAGRNVSYSGGSLDFNAETYLILADNANLNLTNKGSAINSSIALTIYAQANGTGSLTAESTSSGRGIYVKDLTVNGGNITAKSSYHECIWVGGTVTVNGGNVNATGFRGISAYYVTLNGGTVNANGTYEGISTKGVTTLAGATVTASSFASPYSSSSVTVADGLVYTDGNGHYYGGTLSDDDRAAIAGQTISPVATTYSVSIADGIANGSVTVARSYAAAGENVILTVTPNLGYTVESVSYNDGSDHEITPVGDVYAFVMPATAVTVSATFSASISFDTATDVSYIDASGMEQTAPTVNLLTSASTELLAGWYMAASDVTISDNVAFSSDIHLILKDGVTLTINGKLSTSDLGLDNNGIVGSDLTIYRQSAGTGRLTTSGIMAKTVTVNGGVVTSAAGENGIGIGGYDIVIDGGQVTAEATGDYGNGIAAFNTITLGYSRADDFVQATSFAPVLSSITITIKDGQMLTDGTTTYDHDTPSATLEKLDGKTLRPFTTLTLADDADNSSTISGWNGGVADVTLSGRKLTKNGKWNTLCLPFSLNEEQIAASPLAGATIKELDNTASGTSLNNEGTLTLKFNTADEIVAGTPYIIKWTTTGSNIEDPEFTGVTISSTEPTPVVSNDSKVTFVGQYSLFAIDETNINSVIMLSSGNRLGFSNANRTLRPFRAHFEVPGENPVRDFVLDFDGETSSMLNAECIMHNGADAWYSLDGRKLDNMPTKKGLYIHNGKKVAIK